jgi:hypothetical protein
LIQRIREEHLDRVALVSVVAASVGVEVAVHFERITLRVGDVDRPAVCRLRNALTRGVEAERVSAVLMVLVAVLC